MEKHKKTVILYEEVCQTNFKCNNLWMHVPFALYIGAYRANSVMDINAAFHTSLHEPQ
jgi:hypothetical protein